MEWSHSKNRPACKFKALTPLLTGCGKLYTQDEIVITVAVQLLHSARSIVLVQEIDEGKAAAFSGVAVVCNVDARNLAKGTEEFLR